MVKARQPNKPSAPEEPVRDTGHPLLKNESHLLEFMRRYKESDEKKEIIIERIEEWKDCINRIASTRDGQYFLKMLIKFSGLFTPRNIRDTVKMVEDSGKAAFYLTYVRPYLEPKLRKDIE